MRYFLTLRHQLNVQEADGSNPVALINYIKDLVEL
jgi:hypothetical protein